MDSRGRQVPDISGSADSVEYILYVVSGEKNSRIAVNAVSWGPGDLSADGLIKYQDLREIKRVFGSVPGWITKVPWLVNTRTRMHWNGSACMNKLTEINETYATKHRHIQDNPMELALGTHARPELQQAAPINVVLPPDPRDVFLKQDAVPSVASTVAEKGVKEHGGGGEIGGGEIGGDQFSLEDTYSRDVVLKTERGAGARRFDTANPLKSKASSFIIREEEDYPHDNQSTMVYSDTRLASPPPAARFNNSNVMHFDVLSEPPTPMIASANNM